MILKTHEFESHYLPRFNQISKIYMYFLQCSYLKKRNLFNSLLKDIQFCGFFQVNLGFPGAILEFNAFKKYMFKYGFRYMFYNKKNSFKFLGLNKLVNGPILIVFCEKDIAFKYLQNAFFNFFVNKPYIINLCFFLHRRFMFLKHLCALKTFTDYYNIYVYLINLLRVPFFKLNRIKTISYGK